MRKHGRSLRKVSLVTNDADDPLFVVLDSIRQINQELRILGRSTEQRLGVSSAQLFVLEALSQSPADSLNDLAARTYTRHSSVSVVVSRLVEAGLVERTPSPEDGRRITLALTRSGRALLRSAPESAQRRLLASARSLSPTRLSQLASGLSALRRELIGSDEGARIASGAR